MSKIKVLVVLTALLMSVLLLSSCDISDIGDISNIFNPGADGTTEPSSQTTRGDDTSKTTDEECTHEFGEWEVILEATCAQKGKQIRVCALCMHVENSDIDLKSHTIETLAKVEPTCKVEGKTEGEKCSVCQMVLQPQETIPTIAHQYNNGKCTMCGNQDTGDAPAKKYTVVFKDYNGTVLSTQSVNEGGAATAPGTPMRDGYEFIGWDTAFSAVTSDIVVTAMYKEITAKPQFVVSSKDAKRGDTIEVTVALKNNPGIASIILSIAFDSDALTLTEVVYNTAIGGQTVQPQNANSPVKLYWINGFADTQGDFVFATLKFTVKSDATVGDHNITLSYNADDVYDISEKNVTFEIVNGKVTVKQ